MMQEDILETALRLEKAGEPFVLAIVVRAEKPTSAKPGAKAIIKEDGEWIGWIGGSCSQPSVAYEAKRALSSGEPRLVQLASTETCASGGSLDIYLEPHMPKPHLVVVGHLPIAEALVTFAGPLGFRTTVMTPEGSKEQFSSAEGFVGAIDFDALGPGGDVYVVVASHGNYDEEGVTKALTKSDSPYVALVSSRKRAQAVLDGLSLSEEQRARLKYPAGLDIGAVTPEEIALSILAEVVSVRRSQREIEEPAAATDPVCGMTVAIETARYTLESDGETYYFCGAGCKDRFAHAH